MSAPPPPLPPVLSPRTVQLVLPSRPAAPPPPQPFNGRRSSSSATSANRLPPPPQHFSQPSSVFSFAHSHSHLPASATTSTSDGAEGQPPHLTPQSHATTPTTPTHSSRPTALLLSQHRQDALLSQLLKMGFSASVSERSVAEPGIDSVERAVERALRVVEEDEEAGGVDGGIAVEAGAEEAEADDEDGVVGDEVKDGVEEASEALSAQPATTTQRHSPSIDVTLSVDNASASFSPATQWQCSQCTLVNPSTRRRCEACNTRHVTTESPPTVTPRAKPAAYVEPVDGGKAAVVPVGVRLSSRPCQICFECVAVDQVVSSTCSHIFCRDCMSGYVTSKLNDGHVLNVHCPFPNCQRLLASADFLSLLPPDLHTKYERFRLNADVALDPNARWCPTAGCDSVLKRGAGGKGGDRLKCSKCKHSLCFSCNEVWHEGRTCEQAANGVMAAYRRTHDVRQCPECHTTIERSEGCNHMTCTRCKYQFCWLCSRHYTKHHFAFWNLLGCPGLQAGELSWLGNDRLCCINCGLGCGCAGVVKRFLFRLWILFAIGVTTIVFAVPAMLGGLLCGPCLVWRWRKRQQDRRERRARREQERTERQQRRRERAIARDEIDEAGRVLSPEERRERRRARREAQEKHDMEEAIRLSQLEMLGGAGRSSGGGGGDGSMVAGVGSEGRVARLQLPTESPRSVQFKTLADLPLSTPREVVVVVH